jgi:hypothetical protein
MGIWPLPNANSLDVIKRCMPRWRPSSKTCPGGLQARVAYDATDYIDNAIKEVVKTLSETLLIVVVVIFLFLGSLPLGTDPGRGHPAVADRRRLFDAGLRLHRQPADPAGHRPFGRPGGG